MIGKPVRPRRLARQDVEALDAQAGANVALAFIDAVEATFRAIADRPAAGSPRYAQELVLPGLRSRAVKRYPYLVFTVERDDRIDVWRVLHAERDIAAWMRGGRRL